jgi:hypothetical protein
MLHSNGPAIRPMALVHRPNWPKSAHVQGAGCTRRRAVTALGTDAVAQPAAARRTSRRGKVGLGRTYMTRPTRRARWRAAAVSHMVARCWGGGKRWRGDVSALRRRSDGHWQLEAVPKAWEGRGEWDRWVNGWREAWEGGAHRGQASVAVVASHPMKAAVVQSLARTSGSRRVGEWLPRVRAREETAWGKGSLHGAGQWPFKGGSGWATPHGGYGEV